MGRENFLSRVVSGTASAVYSVGSAALKSAKAVTNGALSLVRQSMSPDKTNITLKEAMSTGSEVKEPDSVRSNQQISADQFEGGKVTGKRSEKKRPIKVKKIVKKRVRKKTKELNDLPLNLKSIMNPSTRWYVSGKDLAEIAINNLGNVGKSFSNVEKLIFGEFGQGGALCSKNVVEFVKELKIQIGDLEKLKKRIDDSKFGISKANNSNIRSQDEIVFKAIQNSIQPNSVISMIDTLGIQKAHLFGNRIFNEEISRAIYPEFMMHPITEEVRAQVADNLVEFAKRFGGAKSGDLPDTIHKAVCKAINVLNVEQAEKVAKAMGIKSKEDFEHLETQEAVKNNEEDTRDSGQVAHSKKSRMGWVKDKLEVPEKNKEAITSKLSQNHYNAGLELKKAFKEVQLKRKAQFSFLETKNSGN